MEQKYNWPLNKYDVNWTKQDNSKRLMVTSSKYIFCISHSFHSFAKAFVEKITSELKLLKKQIYDRQTWKIQIMTFIIKRYRCRK